MKNRSDTQASANGRFSRLSLSLWALLIAGAVFAGCRTAGPEQQAALRPFDAQKVVSLSHEAYKVAWDATFWARRDLRIAPFHPSALDWDTVDFLDEITRKAPWVARDIENHPATPRVSSKRSCDFLLYDAMMLKKRFQPTSFRSATNIKIEHLLRILDEIASYYDEGAGTK